MSDSPWEATGKFLAGVVLFGVSVLAYAYVLKVLWGWFVTPFGLPGIGLAHAYGLSLTVGMVAKRWTVDDGRSFWQAVGTGLAASVFVLLFGWFAHLMM